MKTVGELREKLKDLPDDTPILITSSNPELKGSAINYVDVYVNKYVKKKRTFTDIFDHSSYSTEVYCLDSEGDTCVWIG